MKYLVIIFSTALVFALGYPQGEIKGPANDDDSDMYMEPQQDESQVDEQQDNHEASQQTFYPSFSPYQNPPLGHSRPYLHQPETAYSQRPQSAYQQQQVAYDSPRYTGYKDDGYRSLQNSESHGILGSGNFGVIRGGTFYDNDGDSSANTGYDNDFNSYFRNGHGRPSFYFGGVPNPKPYQHEQFENFRDFADINTPTNPAYSQYVVVYVNRNATKEDEVHRLMQNKPKNIIESLELLDLESTTTTTELPVKKVSKSKAKLALVPPEKKHQFKQDKKISTKVLRELHEPLLALS